MTKYPACSFKWRGVQRPQIEIQPTTGAIITVEQSVQANNQEFNGSMQG
jgi:hypothetical protein